MQENKIIHVDFKTGSVIGTENHEVVEPRLDPVLEQVKQEISPEHFEIYERTVDDWMRRNFEYQMEQGGKMYDE